MIVGGPKIDSQPKIFSVPVSVSTIILIINGTNKKTPIHAQVTELQVFASFGAGEQSSIFKRVHFF